MSDVRCPRCELRFIRPGKESHGQSLSHMTRDDGTRVYICSDCAIREAMREHVGLAPIPLAGCTTKITWENDVACCSACYAQCQVGPPCIAGLSCGGCWPGP